MKNLIAEQPLILAALLAAIAAAVLWGWVQTGKRPALWTGLLVLALIPISWYISVRWVTDREQIREVIYATAEAVKENDFARAVQIIEPQRRDLVASTQADLARFHFSEARVNQLRSIEMVQGSYPPEAQVDLTATAVVNDQRGQFSNLRVLRRVVLSFRKADDGKWYVYDYHHVPVVGPPDARQRL